MTGQQKHEKIYKQWFVGKRCKPKTSPNDFKIVKNVEFIAPPSGMVGVIILTYQDNSTDTIGPGTDAMRPRKTDVEIHENDIHPARNV